MMDQVIATGAGRNIGLWREGQSQSFHRIGLLEVSQDICHTLSWNSTNSYLSCCPRGGDHISLLSYDKEQLDVVCRIEGKQLVEESDGMGGVTSACFLGNGHQLAIGVTSPAVVLWDIDNTDSIIRRYIGHTSLITSISRNTKDTHIASGLEDGSLTLHKLTSTQPIASLSSSGDTTKQSIKSVKFSPIESGMIGTCDANGTVKLWSSESQRLLSTFTNIHTGSANDISYSPYNRMLMASAGQNGIICLYDLIQRKIITQISHSSSLTSVLLLKDGVTMLVGTNDGELLVYNMRNCKEPFQVIKAHNKPINSLAAQNQIKVKTSRKMPNKSLKKKVTIDLTNSENITPSFDTPAAVTKIDKSSVFSPIDSYNVTPLTNDKKPSLPSSVTLRHNQSLTPSRSVDVDDKSPQATSSIFSPLESKPLPLSVTNKLLNESVTATKLSSFPSESTLMFNIGNTDSGSGTINSINSPLPQPAIQSTPFLLSNNLITNVKRQDEHISTQSSSTTVTTTSTNVCTTPSTVPTTTPTATTATPTATTTGSSGGVQVTYLENLLKEQQEEITWSIHRDINNLNVTMLRQFATLQNQMILALTAVSEKVDKLQDEVEQLKHQVNHLTPKY